MSEPAPSRAPFRCSICSEPGHNARTCSQTSDHVAEIARLRERQDALAAEVIEYQRVRDTLDHRIQTDLAEISQLGIDIARLRRGSF